MPGYFLDHLRTRGYHPRSDKHSKAVADAIVIDLMAHCPKIATEALADQVAFDYNVELVYGHSRWKTDLAIGPPAPGAVTAAAERVAGMARSTPTWTRVAVEAKTVMTKHTGARKNRKRDLEAHHQHVHDYDANAIAASITVINAAPEFYSPYLQPACGRTAIHTDLRSSYSMRSRTSRWPAAPRRLAWTPSVHWWSR